MAADSSRVRNRERLRTNRDRLDVRLSAERKALLQHAADLEGRSLTDFILSSADEKAEETIRRHEVLTLSVRDSRAFVEAILTPSEPNDRLRQAAQRYREFVGE